MRKAALRWSRTPREKGLRGVCGDRGYILTQNGIVLIKINSLENGHYYWYGSGHNTLWEKQTFETLDAAKKDAVEWLRME